jgi:hypothetical protein
VAVTAAELDILIKAGVTGQSGIAALSGELVGLTVIGAGAYVLGKNITDTYEEMQSASNNLSQAFKTQGEAVPTAQIQSFLDKNKAAIDDQFDVEQGIALATRAGLSWKDTQLLMQDALDLSIAKHETFSQAMDTLVKAAAGGRAQLADLGITSKQLSSDTDAVANAQKAATKADEEKATADWNLKVAMDGVNESHHVSQTMLDHLAEAKAKDLAATQNAEDAHDKLAAAMNGSNASGDRALILHNLLDPKLAHETDTITDLQKHQKELNTDWQNFAVTVGPAVTWVEDGITRAADNGLGILTEYIQMVEAIIHAPGKFGTAVSTIGTDITGMLHIPNPFNGGRQFGGQVYSGQSYLVGENGPELLNLSQGASGNITPNNQLGGIASNDDITMRLDQLIEIAAAQLGQSSGGLGYSTLAAVEYNRSRGIQ